MLLSRTDEKPENVKLKAQSTLKSFCDTAEWPLQKQETKPDSITFNPEPKSDAIIDTKRYDFKLLISPYDLEAKQTD